GNPAPGWLYYGFESVAAISPDVVDWLLLEVRDAPDVQNATAATTEDILPAFLLNNGTLTKPEGNGNPITSAIIDYGMFVVVHHRNHVSIINPVPIPENAGVYTWDFTGGAYGAAPGAKEIAPGVWAMMGGDGNADNQINTQDKLDAWWNEAGSSGYRGSDFDMNGQTGNQDKLDIWQPNSGQSSQVPD
ncbi:MAG: hypothetical protein JXA03_04755, partial [Bacteroidales bacterium]|nr:hypothetical protein [Bacteroidales bacterium]